MKISQLIKNLETIKNAMGDLPVDMEVIHAKPMGAASGIIEGRSGPVNFVRSDGDHVTFCNLDTNIKNASKI